MQENDLIRLYINAQKVKQEFIISVEQPNGRSTDISKATDFKEVCDRMWEFLLVVGPGCRIKVR